MDDLVVIKCMLSHLPTHHKVREGQVSGQTTHCTVIGAAAH